MRPPPHPSAEEPVRVITVATHDEGYFSALAESCHRAGMPLTVLGWGERWRGFNWKFNLVRDHLRTLPPAAMVVFVDAFDVVVLQDSAETLRRYRALTGGGDGRVVFSVDNPTANPIMDVVGRMAFSRCGTRIINTGVYMGPAARVIEVLDVVDGRDDRYDDQKLMNWACRDNADFFRRNVVMDMAGHVAFNAVCQQGLGYFGGGNCRYFSIDPADLRNPLTGTVPCFLHAPASLNMDPFCRTLRLPLGKRRPRLTWMLSNWWPEFMFNVAVVAAVALMIWFLWWRWGQFSRRVGRRSL